MNIDNPCSHDIPELKKLWKEAFGDTDETIDGFFNTAFSEKRCMCVKSDGNLAAALYWFGCKCADNDVAYIYAVATYEVYRGKGIFHKLMEHTHQHLKNIGYIGAVLVPGSNSLFDFYEAMGYSVCGNISEINTVASENHIDIRKIDEYEYAGLRRKLLPERGVVQENENLDYLETQAEFYAGDSFLLAAQKHGEKLYGMELLGDDTVISDILCTLNCKSGVFRIAGNERKFAMYYSLGSDEVKPEYFGLAFD